MQRTTGPGTKRSSKDQYGLATTNNSAKQENVSNQPLKAGPQQLEGCHSQTGSRSAKPLWSHDRERSTRQPLVGRAVKSKDSVRARATQILVERTNAKDLGNGRVRVSGSHVTGEKVESQNTGISVQECTARSAKSDGIREGKRTIAGRGAPSPAGVDPQRTNTLGLGRPRALKSNEHVLADRDKEYRYIPPAASSYFLWDDSSIGPVIPLPSSNAGPSSICILPAALSALLNHIRSESHSQTFTRTPEGIVLLGYFLGRDVLAQDLKGDASQQGTGHDTSRVDQVLDRFDRGRKESIGSVSKLVPTFPTDGDIPVLIVRYEKCPESGVHKSINSLAPYMLQSVANWSSTDSGHSRHPPAFLELIEDDERGIFHFEYHFFQFDISLRLTRINPIRIIQNALAQALNEGQVNAIYPMNETNNGGRATKKQDTSGFLTIDQARHILLLAADDPTVNQISTAGIWVKDLPSALGGSPSPTPALARSIVYRGCIKYAQNSGLSKMNPSDPKFLLVVYHKDTINPEMWDCSYEIGALPILYRKGTYEGSLFVSRDNLSMIKIALKQLDIPNEEIPVGAIEDAFNITIKGPKTDSGQSSNLQNSQSRRDTSHVARTKKESNTKSEKTPPHVAENDDVYGTKEESNSKAEETVPYIAEEVPPDKVSGSSRPSPTPVSSATSQSAASSSTPLENPNSNHVPTFLHPPMSIQAPGPSQIAPFINPLYHQQMYLAFLQQQIESLRQQMNFGTMNVPFPPAVNGNVYLPVQSTSTYTMPPQWPLSPHWPPVPPVERTARQPIHRTTEVKLDAATNTTIYTQCSKDERKQQSNSTEAGSLPPITASQKLSREFTCSQNVTDATPKQESVYRTVDAMLTVTTNTTLVSVAQKLNRTEIERTDGLPADEGWNYQPVFEVDSVARNTLIVPREVTEYESSSRPNLLIDEEPENASDRAKENGAKTIIANLAQNSEQSFIFVPPERQQAPANWQENILPPKPSRHQPSVHRSKSTHDDNIREGQSIFTHGNNIRDHPEAGSREQSLSAPQTNSIKTLTVSSRRMDYDPAINSHPVSTRHNAKSPQLREGMSLATLSYLKKYNLVDD
ncbi:hypothetical protein DFS34DRAFT_256683 [Phlyctochytrium arcticum]|nr:hypothetical protein DFS34DRAFT_256683 [Phlyctochytrium arcticum]